MPQDHPDGTVPMQFTGADKKVPTDFQDQYRGVHTEAEFETKQAKDKNLHLDTIAIAVDALATLTYTVTAGKILYVTQACWLLYGDLVADREKNQIGHFYIFDQTAGVYLASFGGNGGQVMPFPRPLAVEGGHVLKGYLHNESKHDCYGGGDINGYEV